MITISEVELNAICVGIVQDKASILKHNPIGTEEETMLWMMLSSLVLYLSLSEQETPCFNGNPDAETYRNAIHFILKGRCESDFDPKPYIRSLTEA